MTHPPASAVRDKAAEVFQRPEFQSEPSAPTWLFRVLRDFFAWLGSLYENSPLLFWLLLIGCVLLLIAIVVHIVWQVRKVFAGRERASGPGDRAGRMLLSIGYREEAVRRAEAGDYTEAVRFLFLSLVYRFDERGRVSLHKDCTNREYLDALDDRMAVQDALRVMVDVLDDHWYGQGPCRRGQ